MNGYLSYSHEPSRLGDRLGLDISPNRRLEKNRESQEKITKENIKSTLMMSASRQPKAEKMLSKEQHT